MLREGALLIAPAVVEALEASSTALVRPAALSLVPAAGQAVPSGRRPGCREPGCRPMQTGRAAKAARAGEGRTTCYGFSHMICPSGTSASVEQEKVCHCQPGSQAKTRFVTAAN